MPRGEALPAWVVPIAAIVALQTIAAYLARITPIAAPAFIAEFGWNSSVIGYLVAANTVGALIILTVGAGLVRGYGAVTVLLVTLAAGALSVGLFTLPSLMLALSASFVMGFSNGAMHPAGTEVMQRFTPPQHRNVVFSVKQAGVPLGGVLAGLTIAPMIDTLGWRAALAIAIMAVLLTAAPTWPLRSRIDSPGDASALRWGSIRMLAVPLQSLTKGPGLLRVALGGGMLVATQSAWFSFMVTYLVIGLGWSVTRAGLVFAIMQAASVVGRILMGWVADRIGSGRVALVISGMVSVASTLVLAFGGAGLSVWGFGLLAVVGGLSVSAFNGVLLAEVARRSPPGLVVETASGAGILTFTGNMVGPTIFAILVAWTDRFDWGYAAAAASSLLGVLLLRGAGEPDRR